MREAVDCRRIYTFAGFQLDASRRILRRGDELVALPPKAVDLLTVLVENAGEVVDKTTLFDHVWPDTYVVESSLTKNISVLRKALDQNEGTDSAQSIIQTVSKRGYRFVAQVRTEELAAQEADTPPALVKHPVHRKLIAGAAVGVLAIALIIWRKAVVFSSDESSAARKEYLIGLHLWGKAEPSEVLKALARFQRATELQPDGPLGWAGVADTYYLMTTMGIGNPTANLSGARLAAARALDLDSRLALSHVVLGHVRLLADFDARGAEHAFVKAIKLDPGLARARYAYACLLTVSGRFDEARAEIRHALDLDPVAPIVGVQAARAEYFARDYDQAIRMLRDVLDREPSYSTAHYYMAMSLGQLGRFDEALSHLQRVRGNRSRQETDLAWLHAMAGDRKPAEALVRTRQQDVASGKAKPTVLVLPAIAAGDNQLALSSLEAMWPAREIELLHLKVSPRFDPLRSHPRFEALLQRVWP